MPTMRQHSGFFSHPPVKTAVAATKLQPAFINMGGSGDCGFRAVAAGLIDNFLSGHRFKPDLISKVLKRHKTYFKEHRLDLVLATPLEELRELTRRVPMAELIQKMAYTLRQMAVDELCANPARYRGAFADKNEHTSPEMMRKPSTWIDESAIAALSNTLGLPIEVRVVEAGKEVPMRLRYNTEATNPGVVMQLRGEHYIPRVTQKEAFGLVKHKSAPHVEMEEVQSDPSLSEILAIIAEEDKQLCEEFASLKHRLMTMVAAGELNKADLLKLYVKGMPTSDYLQGRVKCVGTEYGTQHFFEAITQAQKEPEAIVLTEEQYDEAMINELVHALARAISIGDMPEEQVFAQIDDESELRRHSIVR
ncbi:OTU domain-containing protein [Legionella nagasakiensis]|uniref:OTU domain-containing protein n=1 Tax=Legionella nagasakiensis TaxID=535290 RepID=UPI001056BD02|nr:OTU domain-containing protein [Legionella nagasakiensis]